MNAFSRRHTFLAVAQIASHALHGGYLGREGSFTQRYRSCLIRYFASWCNSARSLPSSTQPISRPCESHSAFRVGAALINPPLLPPRNGLVVCLKCSPLTEDGAACHTIRNVAQDAPQTPGLVPTPIGRGRCQLCRFPSAIPNRAYIRKSL